MAEGKNNGERDGEAFGMINKTKLYGLGWWTK